MFVWNAISNIYVESNAHFIKLTPGQNVSKELFKVIKFSI